MKKIKPEIIVFAVVAVVLAGIIAVTLTSTPSDTASTASSASSKISAGQNGSQTKAQLNKVALPQLTKTVASDETEVIMHTTDGDITVKLFNAYAPLAVYNFTTLAKNGYYNGLTFHRVIKDFMIQGGDPSGDGTGGHSIWYETEKNTNIDSGTGFQNEVTPSLYNIRGALSMANTGQANSNGSQFFIVQNKDNQQKSLQASSYPTKIYKAYKNGGYPSGDGNYTVFGQVIKGMSVVDKIANAKVTSSDSGESSTPADPVKIDSIEIVQEAPVDISTYTNATSESSSSAN